MVVLMVVAVVVDEVVGGVEFVVEVVDDVVVVVEVVDDVVVVVATVEEVVEVVVASLGTNDISFVFELS